jgi:glycine/D-amino acid oxidase-like deaminating enzyme
MRTWDAIVVGGGMAGLSTAYHLARLGARTLLLQAGDLGGGTSAACTGRAQVNEGHLDPLNVRLIRDGMAALDTLEEELGAPFEWRRLGYLCLIRTAEQWAEWAARAATLTAAGIATDLLPLADLRAAEPNLDANGYLGAAYSVEGFVNPLLFCWAYARAARLLGAELRPHAPVEAMEVEGDRVLAVWAHGTRLLAERVAIACGPWTAQVARLAGAELPIHHTHAEAFVTEPLPGVLHNTLGLADFYETIHRKAQAVSVGVSPEANGALVVTEAVTQTDELHKRTSAWGLAGMAADLVQLVPALAQARAVRAWGAPTPYTPDDEPLIGWVPRRANLFVAAGFLLTITAIPVLSDWMARMILGETLPVSLEQYSPARFA